MAQMKTPEQVVQANLDFYNARDIEGFSSLLTEDVGVYELGKVRPIAVGLPTVKTLYKKLFDQSPKLQSTILKRIVMGNTVIDHESIVGRKGSKDILELVAIYQVTGDKIERITIIRK